MEKIGTENKGLTVESGKGQQPSGIKVKKTYEETITPDQIKRVEQDWSRLAGEQVVITIFDNDFVAYGSERACLRLAYCFKRMPSDRIEVAFSSNLNTWYFVKYNK